MEPENYTHRRDLAGDHLLGAPALTLGRRFADADQRLEARLERGGQLAAHLLVGLAEQVAPLRVTDQHRGGAGLHHEGNGKLAGEGALRLPVNVLRADDDIGALLGRLVRPPRW